MSLPTLNRKAHNFTVRVTAGCCFMLMLVGFFNIEIAGVLNGPAWLLLGLIASERLK